MRRIPNTIFRTYYPFGRVTAEWGATYPVRYAYDTQRRCTSLSTTRDGTTWDTTTWTYEHATGNCLSKTYADGSTVTYTYTPDNLLLRTTYPSGKWKENVYDAQCRLCGVVYSSSDMDYEFQLDEYGNATNVQDAAGNTWRYTYGFNSRLLAEEYATPGGTQFIASAMTNTISRSVDQFDRPIGYTFSVNGESKGSVGYAYDDAGDLTRITATNSAGRSFSVAYTNITGYSCGYTITTPNGDTIRRVVDRDEYRRNLVTNCATYFNSSLVDSNDYFFDALSRPTTRTTGATGGSPVDSTFSYNNRSEVVFAAIGTNIFTHAYDDIGNHLFFGDNAVTNTFTHNQVNQMVGRGVPDAPPTSFSYTPDGGLSLDGSWSYAYDAEDQLTSVTSSALTNGAIRVLNSYDYRHRRTSKTVQRLYSTIAPPPSPPVGIEEWQTIEMRTFVYDDWNLIHETIYTIDGGTTNTTEFQYFWGLDLSDTLHGAGGVGGLLALSSNGLFYFPTYDNNGNVTKYIDESGNVVAAYEYDDFGRLISQSGPLADFFRLRFSTKYYDPETGLYYYGERFYSPYWRIWLNRDPIGELDCPNLYDSFGNSPTFATDPLGKTVFIITDPIPSRKTSITVKRGSRTISPRGVTRIKGSLTFSCDKNCILHAKGVIQLWIELLNEDDSRWNKRYPQYSSSTNNREDLNTLSHEMDHFSTWSAFLDFVKTANTLDGKKFTNCKDKANQYNMAYKRYMVITSAHSSKFDQPGWNQGGQYSKHPLNTSTFKWE